MSATVETNTASWRKRLREDDTTTQMDLKRPRYYYYRLESESSKASEEDTESVCSLQDRETDVVKDTTDTDSKSECSGDEYEVHYEEYEVASLSGSENGFSHSNSSSDSEGMMLAAAAVAICDSSLETWITDCEDSDNSSLDGTPLGKTDFSTCIQCKSDNDNPLYRYCEKCFQDRKKFYPPRPKRNKKSRRNPIKEPPVKLDTLRSYLKDLSQDSGIGSSQEWPVLDLAQIVVPEKHLPTGTSQISTVTESNESVEDGTAKEPPKDVETVVEKVADNDKEKDESVEEGKTPEKTSISSTDTICNVKRGRKRQLSESSLSDFDSKPRQTKIPKVTLPESEQQLSQGQMSDLGSEISSSSFVSSISSKINVGDNSELCIFCNDAPKDAIFLHAKVAHQCCCYRCAKRTIKTRKRCPICNVTVNKVFRVIKS